MKKITLMIPLLLLGCGGDNKSDPTNDTENRTYSLEKVTSLTEGELYSFKLVSAETDQGGVVAITNRQETVVSGVIVTPQDRYFTITRRNAGSSNLSAPIWQTTYHIDTATKNLISFTTFASSGGIGTRINCSSSSPYHFPTQVKSGDSDSTPGFICDNDIMISSGSWRAESTSNGNLNFIVHTQTVDASGKIMNETTTYTLDPQGNVVSLQINELKSITE